ncbi:hypothetical protein US8_02698 [Bacillus altitudinis]|nr:hypothetical protein US8_02698 [Bacillus altitudinis]
MGFFEYLYTKTYEIDSGQLAWTWPHRLTKEYKKICNVPAAGRSC